MERSLMYDRQEELVSPPNTVHIVGCGGVGTWAAIFLALSGVPKLHLYEDDTIEESNLNRLPYAPGAIGKAKIDLLEKMLHKLRPDIELVLHGRFHPLLHKFGRDRVIGVVDTMHDRQSIHAACRETGAYYIDVGAESHHCTISDSPAEWGFVEDRPGYFTPIWVAPVAMAAALAVAAVTYRNISTGQTVAVNLRGMHLEDTNEPQEEQAQAGRAMVGEQVGGLARATAETIEAILRRADEAQHTGE